MRLHNGRGTGDGTQETENTDGNRRREAQNKFLTFSTGPYRSYSIKKAFGTGGSLLYMRTA